MTIAEKRAIVQEFIKFPLDAIGNNGINALYRVYQLALSSGLTNHARTELESIFEDIEWEFSDFTDKVNQARSEGYSEGLNSAHGYDDDDYYYEGDM